MGSRVLPVAIAGSVVVHLGALLAVWDTAVSHAQLARDREAIEIEIVSRVTPLPAAPLPVELVVIDDVASSIAATDDDTTDRARASVVAPTPDRRPIAATTTTTTAAPTTAAPTTTLAMRTATGTATAADADIAIQPPVLPSAVDLAGALVPELGPPPEFQPFAALEWMDERAPTSELKPAGNGTFEADDLMFTAAIGSDGRVKIEDKPNFHVELALPSAAAIAGSVLDWYADPYNESQKDQRAVETGTVTFFKGGFDLTDWAMRRIGDDPYLRRKALFLDRTRDERAQIAAVDQSERLRDAVATLRAYLGDIWAYDGWSAERRRALLFELWDECAETGAEQVVSAGDQARATVIGFVRRTLPAGTDDAYGEEEIERLNAGRMSKRAFAPY